MVSIRKERAADLTSRERLLDDAFGRARWRKTSQRLRHGRAPAEGLSFVAAEGGRIIGTARLWEVTCHAGRRALLLGPVAVAAECRNRGVGAALVRHSINAARRRGHRAIVLIGDASYYARFGFSSAKTLGLRMPGPFDPERLLGLELSPGALDGARGLLRADGRVLEPEIAASAA